VTRLLRASPFVEGCKCCHVFWFFFCRAHGKVRPLDTGPDPYQRRSLRHRNLAKELPSARRRHFCILLLPDKSMASGGTHPAGSAFKKIERGQQMYHLLPSLSSILSELLSSLRGRPKPAPQIDKAEDLFGTCKFRVVHRVTLVAEGLPIHAAVVAMAVKAAERVLFR